MTAAETSGRPRPNRRAAAAPDLIALATALIFLVAVSLHRFGALLASVVPLSVIVVAAWYGVSRRGRVRVAAVVTMVVALVVFVVVVVASESIRVLAVGLASVAAVIRLVPLRPLRVGGRILRRGGRHRAGTALPLRVAAGVVAFTRVYTGVHYPGEVLVGASIGAGFGRLTVRVASRLAQKGVGMFRGGRADTT